MGWDRFCMSANFLSSCPESMAYVTNWNHAMAGSLAPKTCTSINHDKTVT